MTSAASSYGIAWVLLILLGGYYFWRYARPFLKGEQKTGLEGFSALNDAARNVVGRQFPLQEAIENGRGKIIAGDDIWPVCGADLPAGTMVKVIDQVGRFFVVVKAPD